MRRAGFALDLDRCTGCSACTFACRIENDLPAGTSFRRVTTFNPGRVPGLPVLHLSLACNHCEHPACLAACPTGAYTRNPLTGTVDLHDDRCMGCRYCSWVCPYDAPQLDRSRGVMTKCTFCTPRVERGAPPACVVACPVDALQLLDAGAGTKAGAAARGVRLDHASVPGFPNTGLEPAIAFVSRLRWRQPPDGKGERKGAARRAPRWERLNAEWPLAVFTLLMAVLVGWFGAGAWGGPRPMPLPFFALAGLGLGVSVLHLGRPARMWRALRNIRSSWISREIAFVTVFLAAAAAQFVIAPASRPFTWTTAALGLAAVIAVDSVYRIRGQVVRTVPHSGLTTLTALYLAALWGAVAWLAAGVALAKLVLYARRHWGDWGTGSRVRSLPPVMRITLGFLVPGAVWITGGSPFGVVGLACVLVAEAADRAEFYAELDFLDPERQAAMDLAELGRNKPHGGAPARVAARPVQV